MSETNLSPSWPGLSIPVWLVKLHYLFLAPWIVFSIPAGTVLGQPLLFAIAIGGIGVVGTLTHKPRMALDASLTIVLLIVAGRIVGDVYRLESYDTSILLLQFVSSIFLMEATMAVIDYDKNIKILQGRSDGFSKETVVLTRRWLRRQLFADSKLGLSSFVMSLGLLVIGGLAGVSVSHLALLGILVLASVVALLFLLTYNREPETPSKRK